MQYTRKYEQYHRVFTEPISEESVEPVLRELVDKQRDDNIFITFTMYERTRNFNEHVTTAPMPQNQYIPYHQHDYFEINYLYEGVCYQFINNKLYKMAPGDLIILSENTFHTAYTRPGSSGINLLVDDVFLSDFIKELPKSLHSPLLTELTKEKTPFFLFPCTGSAIPSFFDVLKQRGNLLGQRSLEYRLRENLARCIFSEMLIMEKDKRLTFTSSDEPEKAEISHAAVLEFINANFHSISIEDIEKKFGFSRMGFYRFMKTATGTHFSVYVGSLKYNRACYLLQYSTKSISQIAEEVGFQSNEYFSRFFKKQAGITPTVYRRRMKAKAEKEKRGSAPASQ